MGSDRSDGSLSSMVGVHASAHALAFRSQSRRGRTSGSVSSRSPPRLNRVGLVRGGGAATAAREERALERTCDLRLVVATPNAATGCPQLMKSDLITYLCFYSRVFDRVVVIPLK